MKTIITTLMFLAMLCGFSQVGINTDTPLSMLDINGNLSVKHLTLPANGTDTGLQLIDDGVYISINPQVQDQEFRLPNAIDVPGRIYIIRNINNALTARLTSAGGLFFKRNFTNDGRTELFMFDNSLRTIIAFSDGVSWNTFNDF
ncbi:hypothetical protein [Paucihalobacter sp.]|uniref:hypothetical protein n=1 Tax=Paucihalobacter sp. TaxID=2850405 RepID=UPI002FE227BE